MHLNKRLDQFFLKNGSIINEEAEAAELAENDNVLEIGAGDGKLTSKLAEKCNVIAIEIDKRFIPELKKIRNAEIICGDALKILKQKREGRNNICFNKIVSNIPYSISKKIILEILRHKWNNAVMIVQKEFAQKLAGESKLSLLVEDCCEFEIIGYVPASAFVPTAIDSALIRMRQKKLMDEHFWSFLNKIYHKNKNVKNTADKYPEKYAKMKVHQLSLKEIKEIYESNRD